MNISGINCYIKDKRNIKTRRNFSFKFIHIFLPIEVKVKDLYNSNDFSLLSVMFQSLYQLYELKDISLIEKKLFLISKENCIFLEQNFLRKTFLKKTKNFSYWQLIQWVFEKECFSNFYIISTFIFVFLSINPNNYYICSFFCSYLKREKTKTWVTLTLSDSLYSVDNFKELGWNLKSNSCLNLKQKNVDTLFNFSSAIKFIHHQACWKFFNNILLNSGITRGTMFSCVSILIHLRGKVSLKLNL